MHACRVPPLDKRDHKFRRIQVEAEFQGLQVVYKCQGLQRRGLVAISSKLLCNNTGVFAVTLYTDTMTQKTMWEGMESVSPCRQPPKKHFAAGF